VFLDTSFGVPVQHAVDFNLSIKTIFIHKNLTGATNIFLSKQIFFTSIFSAFKQKNEV